MITESPSEGNVSAVLLQRLSSGCINKSKIKIDNQYGYASVFFTEDVNSLLIHLKVNWTDKRALRDANVVTILAGPCTAEKIHDIELFLKAAWFQLFIFHHIAFLIDCEVNMSRLNGLKIIFIDTSSLPVGICFLRCSNRFGLLGRHIGSDDH